MADKRGAHRIRVRLPARYLSERARIDGWVENLSRCGLFLRAPIIDAAGTEAKLAIEVSGHAPLEITGEVVRIDNSAQGPGMAIRFTQVSSGAMHRLANYVIEQSYLATA